MHLYVALQLCDGDLLLVSLLAEIFHIKVFHAKCTFSSNKMLNSFPFKLYSHTLSLSNQEVFQLPFLKLDEVKPRLHKDSLWQHICFYSYIFCFVLSLALILMGKP